MSIRARTVEGVAAARIRWAHHRCMAGSADGQRAGSRPPSPSVVTSRSVYAASRLLGPRPRVVGRPGALGVAAVEHQRRDPLGVRGGQQHGHRAALGVAAQHRPAGTDGVHHGQHVVHARLEVGHARRAVGHPGAPLVEPDQPTERAEPVEEVGVPRVRPVLLEVGHEARDQHDVPVATAGDLVGDVQAVADGVADRRRRPGRPAAPPPAGPGVRRPGHLHRADEPVAAAVHRPDHLLRLPVVPERAAHLLDPAGDGGLGDEPAAPDGVHQLVLGDHPVAVRDQVGQDVERLRLQRDRPARTPQLEQRGVQLQTVAEGQRRKTNLPQPGTARTRAAR